jgi:predicted nuclease of predicted toxin-antitoxin system
MATRMQQRRGTAAQWTAANPILAAGEIGFETDTSKFKMGNGSSTWSALQYFANASELAAIIGGDMPALLNSLDELAQAINDDPQFYLTMGTNLTNHQNDTTMIHGIVDTALLATTGDVNTAATGAAVALAAHASDTTLVHGIADTALLATTGDVATAAQGAATALSAHEADITNVHGIADTSVLATLTNVSTAKSEAIADAATASSTAISTHNSDTTNVHGIADTSLLATTGNVSTAKTEAITAAGEAADTALSTHNSDTSNVHGINDTTVLVTQQQLTDAVNGAVVDQSALAGVGIDWNTGTEAFDIDSTVATKTYADDAVTTHNSDTTNVHGIADTSLLALKSEVEAITKSSLGLANVDNTADASKPVSTAQASAIATAKSEAIADATSQVNALLAGAPAALNTLDELAAALGDDANFASSVTTSLGLKVDSLTPISQKTASYTLSSLTERDDLIEMGSASALTLTIPPASAVDYPIGTSIDILQTGAGQVTIAAGAGVTVNATPGLKLRTTWSSCTLFKRAANTWVVYGDLTA